MKKPGKSDPSRPREDGYDYKRDFYRSAQVADDYDFHRFSSPERQKRNARKWAAIRKALAGTRGVRTILDLPCGTGRFTGALAREGYEIIGWTSLTRCWSRRPASRGERSRDPPGWCVALCRPTPNTAVARRRARLRGLHPFHDHVDPGTRVRMLRDSGAWRGAGWWWTTGTSTPFAMYSRIRSGS